MGRKSLQAVLMGRIGSPAAACSVAGRFCYGRLLDESCIARESQNSPSPARASDRLLSVWLHAKHDIVSFSLGRLRRLVLTRPSGPGDVAPCALRNP